MQTGFAFFEIDTHPLARMRPETLIGKALVVRVITVAVDDFGGAECHQPAVAVTGLVLHRMTGKDAQYAGDFTEYAATFRHHGLDASFIQAFGVISDDVFHRPPGTAGRKQRFRATVAAPDVDTAFGCLPHRLHSAQAAWFMSLRLSTGVNFQQLKRQVK